ncbi:MAG: hypothetical protein NTU99_05050 [Pseudanabaena sp. LacPavin_0818_WC45_MAG_42_6]|nr:hypothetical protein [Pseudanabaena sp. LacPavin_0818_WC45_MAG_42_6]
MIIITVRPSSPTNPIAYSLKSNSDRPFHHPQNPIANTSNQIAIAPQHPQNPIAYSLKSNSDRPLTTHIADRLSPQIKQRSRNLNQIPKLISYRIQ